MPSPTEEDRVNDILYQRLFRLFSYFEDSSDCLHPSQAAFLLEELLQNSGKHSKNINFNGEEVSFREFLGLLDNLFTDRKELESSVERVFERYITQIIRKGFLLYRPTSSRGCLPRKRSSNDWRPAWCSITPGIFYFWSLHNGTTLKNRRTITLDSQTKIENPRKENDRYVWTIQSVSSEYHFAHFDQIPSTTITNDLRLAIEHPTKEDLTEYDRRRATRFDGRQCERETAWRLSLQVEKEKLEEQLAEERRALKDEEIVRSLATRMLEEEKQKSEQMELVLAELQYRLSDQRRIGHLETVEEYEGADTQPLIEYTQDGENREEDDGREYAEQLDADYQQQQDPEVWNKDYLIISTQSI